MVFIGGDTMNEETDLQIEKLKNRIVKENQNNSSNRRRFSVRLRNDIAKFYIESSFTQKELAPLLGVGASSIEKWTRKYKEKIPAAKFKQVQITKVEKKKDNRSTQMSAIKLNQIVLILLLILLLTERVFDL